MGLKQTLNSIWPGRLASGDTIGIVAPASPFDINEFKAGISMLEMMGFRTYLPDGLFNKKGYLAGTNSHRANMINSLFADKSIKAIICARGGFGSMKLLPLIDFKLIKDNPKFFCGFSDISVLLCLLYQKTGLVSFHGPMVTSLASATEKTKRFLSLALALDIDVDLNPLNGIIINSGFATGPLMGGNLTSLCHLVGTLFEPCFKKHLLFLEDKGEPVYKIDRMLTHMKMAGCFDELGGLILGSFEECGNIDDIFEIVESIFRKYDIPILGGFEIGHGINNITVPIGIEARLETDKQLLSFSKPDIS